MTPHDAPVWWYDLTPSQYLIHRRWTWSSDQGMMEAPSPSKHGLRVGRIKAYLINNTRLHLDRQVIFSRKELYSHNWQQAKPQQGRFLWTQWNCPHQPSLPHGCTHADEGLRGSHVTSCLVFTYIHTYKQYMCTHVRAGGQLGMVEIKCITTSLHGARYVQGVYIQQQPHSWKSTWHHRRSLRN